MEYKLNRNSKVKEVYNNPIGYDILHKLLLQMNIREGFITNPVIGNMKLKTVSKLTKKTFGDGFVSTLLELLNSEKDIPKTDTGQTAPSWWKEAVFYQIYPRSFYDSNGDGIGDLEGIRRKLDYLKELGIDAIWLSPIYDSPNDDNGYDIRDYYKIMKEFGSLEDFDRLLLEVHNRDMKLIMDLVINHTSDEHPWFQDAVENENSKYKDYYLFRKSKNDNLPPNNWTSFFSGPAWNYYKQQDLWALHLFSKKQMDLNWDNENLRSEIYQMIQWWLKKGVDGFRLDVINYISKKEGLPDGNEAVGKLMGYYGIEHYFYGPKLHTYLKELKREAFAPYQAFTVGETPGVGMRMAQLLTADYRKELDMIFSFDHLETPGHVRFEDYQYDLNYLKKYMIDWMEHYGSSCWMSLFYENHDNPRMISKVNPDPAYREVIGKLLAMILLTLKGTPFIFQGQEIGAVNQEFHRVEDLKDVESINLYHELEGTLGKEAAFHKVLSGSRDHARTPMQWDASKGAGFTKGHPWIYMDEDFKEWNVKKQTEDRLSVLNFYRELIRLRKNTKALVYGEFEVLNRKKKNLFTYLRKSGEETYLVECNLSNRTIKRDKYGEDYKSVISNYSDKTDCLRPYEATLYRKLS
ncbi:alpha-glucosidase [Mobilitalea sibirica]|uniref:Alpha-glucosidase n=2 Tax=Mobilitalea sibirica TaxID=1462919 RepID=A0A8J7KRQ1_9FIRM|nr:alpha-glucosidase [Mobilitalea sibirica]